MFDDLFPRQAQKFDVGAPSSGEFLARYRESEFVATFGMWMAADDLLRLAASYRGEHDFFTRIRTVNKLYFFTEDLRMARAQKRNVQRNQDDRAEWQGFLDFRLTEDELSECDAWKPKPMDLFIEVDAMVRDDYRLTLSYNKRTELASCTIIDDNPKRKTGGWAISSADSDGASALKMAIFKWLKMERNFEALASEDKPKGRRG